MAMTREEQRAAAERILAKFPMTEEEKRRQRFLETDPEAYPKDKRVCPVCPKEFGKDDINEYSEHVARHSPTMGQWKEAHEKIESGKARAKEQGRQTS
jgi:hypothetical protein